MSDDSDELPIIKAEIAREKRQLADLDVQRSQAQTRLEHLKARLDEINNPGRSNRPGAARVSPQSAPTTAPAKLALFRSLFRGRTDVFPLKFVSKKTGKAGYAPECTNKFVSGVCGLPRVKCAECSNQAFVSVGDRAILNHLQGRHVMGVYPLLEDETCWFLAVDFDKASWREDVSAFKRPATRRARRARWSAPSPVMAPMPGFSSRRRSRPKWLVRWVATY